MFLSKDALDADGQKTLVPLATAAKTPNCSNTRPSLYKLKRDNMAGLKDLMFVSVFVL